MALSTELTTTEPPGDADFALHIEFKKGEGKPQRVFQAADRMIRALQDLDTTLCLSVDTQIESVMVLEEIEVGSLKIWLKNMLERTDDQIMKDLDWRKAVGKYLVDAKYAYLSWVNKVAPDKTLSDVSKEIRDIAAETDVRHLPDYAPPSIQELAENVNGIEEAKAYLIPGDLIAYVPIHKEPVDFNLDVHWKPEELADLSVKERVVHKEMKMKLIVKKPDYLGTSKWEFRHGKKAVTAKITDVDWLMDFQRRGIDVRPGDALQCLVTVEHLYGHDNELISEAITVTDVEDVLEDKARQLDFEKDM